MCSEGGYLQLPKQAMRRPRGRRVPGIQHETIVILKLTLFSSPYAPAGHNETRKPREA